ncbi:MAG: tRNA (N6-isopentenyl adenosine(37)-C2)-methylthiotransferase MiaB [Oligoflexus sp.]
MSETIAQDSNNDSSKKRVHIETWGCQMNVADSEKMLALLEQRNYQLTDSAEDADLVLLNTCHIREKATHKVISRLGRLRVLAENKPGMKVAVTGCVAQAEGQKLMDRASNIDILLGPGKIEELPQLLEQNEKTGQRAIATGFKKGPEAPTSSELEQQAKPTISGKSEVSRYVNIAQGCNNFCTFCVVPFTRGREISRPLEDIASEARSLVQSGAKEITLLGQNVNSYGLDLSQLSFSEGGPFVDLLRTVAQIEGLERLRFTTSNPHDFTRPLAQLFAEFPQLGRYIHLPVQSGDDIVLERMKRKVTVAEYWERINWLRAIDPEMAISTDLIVGFPGESDEQFEATLELVEKLRYSFIFAFKYSPRKNTAAARFRDQIEETVKSQRLAKLNALQDQITREWNQSEIGKEREVLVHYQSRKDENVYYGRTPQFRLVKIPSGRDIVGETVQVKIEDANKTALLGKLI